MTTRALALCSVLLAACSTTSTPPAPQDGGQVDGGNDGGNDGGSDAGADAGDDGGTDGGWALHNLDNRGCSELLGRWVIDAGAAPGFDAGGFSPCLPLPPLLQDVSVSQELGVWYAPLSVSYADDAGCRLAVDWGFDTTNPSEQYHHQVHLELEPDGGLLVGGGLYTLTGGSNCSVPLAATGAPF